MQLPVDFIVASDVVYGDKVEAWDSLIETIRSISRIGRTTDSPRTVLLMAQTARYPVYERQFYKKLETLGFQKIFHKCISRNATGDLDCSSEADACSEWEWDFDFDACQDTEISFRHQLYGFYCN